MKKNKINILTTTSILLAICIASQFMKNVSVYLTGSIVNACIILVSVLCGVYSGIVISIITPITSFFITGSPIIAAVPIIMPLIMIGNSILVLCICLLKNKKEINIIWKMIIGVILKSSFMGITIGLLILSFFLPEKMLAKKSVFQFTYSVVQFITGMFGIIIASVVLKATSGRYKYSE